MIDPDRHDDADSVLYIGHDDAGNITHTMSGHWLSVKLNLDARAKHWLHHDHNSLVDENGNPIPVHHEFHRVRGGRVVRA